ncbi:hypothetical protein SAMN05421823_101641 [Catalinimonas alkaloidigena]|uniref:Uncharacterized protein n=1 Tax=Catalinimonas alkaloidigena TaxID=1075417 RepID=A0A1G8YDC9_9BACT|nr:hypothetical protein [Catalinimonas alkaloidigena]SDK00838.1 hypothetical protein SAMN05421823_101641 [Catalinimonas alkaloidigena]
MNHHTTGAPPPFAQRMARHQITDPHHQGMVVSIFEYPQEWRAQSQVHWNFQDSAMPVWAYASANHPASGASFEFLPVEAFYWLEPNYGFEAAGQRKYGLTCMPPMPAADAMTRLIVAKYRGNRPNLRILGVQPMPHLPQVLNDTALLQAPSESVGVRLDYEENGHAFEEEFYGVKTQQQAGGGTSVQINWGFARLFCFRALRGQLDPIRATCWHMARSVQHNPQWQSLFNQIVQQLNTQHGAKIDAWRAKLQNEVNFQEQLKGYYQDQRDRQNADLAWKMELDQRRQQPGAPGMTEQERWRNELGGETAYQDPNSTQGNYIYHRSTDAVVFMNERGDVVGSEDPSFDPNPGSTHTWRQLRKA